MFKFFKTPVREQLTDVQKIAKTLSVTRSAKKDIEEINFWAEKYNAQRRAELDNKAKSFGTSSEASLCQVWLMVQKINHDIERVCGEGIEELKPRVVYTNTLGEKERVVLAWNRLTSNPAVGKVVYNLLSNAM